jgi:hypothetical protein
MGKPFTLLLAVLLMPLTPADPASAQNYPWCAQYRGRDGARNCGFVTWEQCMATVSGIGGFCERNSMYVPGGYEPGPRKPRRH